VGCNNNNNNNNTNNRVMGGWTLVATARSPSVINLG
jgi:hypothetical protein